MSEWKTIESAPKDGTVIRLRGEKYEPPFVFWWERGRWRTFLFAPARKSEGWWDESQDPIKEWALPAAPVLKEREDGFEPDKDCAKGRDGGSPRRHQ